MNTLWTPQNIANVATVVLTAASTAVTGIDRATLYPGSEIPWDNCTCGLLALAITDRYISRNFPVSAQDQQRNCCDLQVVFAFSLACVRCVPSPTEDADMPTVKDEIAAFTQQEWDAFTVWTTVQQSLASLESQSAITGWVVNDQVSVGPQGGCAGTELHFKVGLSYNCGG